MRTRVLIVSALYYVCFFKYLKSEERYLVHYQYTHLYHENNEIKNNNYPSFQNKNKSQNVNGVSERTDIRTLKLDTKLGEQINNTSLTFEKKNRS